MAARKLLLAISIGAHGLLGVALAAIPAETRHELIAISLAEAPKPKPAARVEPPPPADPPKPAPHAVRAKAAPPPEKTPAAPPPAAASPSLDAVPDFGLALTNGGGGPGLAVPSARPATAPTPAATTKTLPRAGRPAVDDCDEPPAKPKLLSRPTPVYTDDARAAGISGKVRVEITVDDQGRVVSVTVLQGLGHGLDESALAAARAMTFEAAMRCGKHVPATFKVGFTFAPGTP